MSDAQGVELVAGYANDNVPSEPGHSKAKRSLRPIVFLHISSFCCRQSPYISDERPDPTIFCTDCAPACQSGSSSIPEHTALHFADTARLERE